MRKEPSQSPCGDSSPERGSFIRAYGKRIKSSPFGGAGTASAVTERVIRFKNGVQPLSEGRTTRKRNKA